MLTMSVPIHNVCIIDAPYPMAQTFASEGYETCALDASPEPFFDLPAALDAQGFKPDLVIHCERLGVRTILEGLGQIDCPTLFWALDPHLNYFWQSAYGNLFDMVLSTQHDWLPHLKQHGVRDARWLPWFGQERPWIDWKDRKHGVTFVGRLTAQRPARKWMWDYLAQKAAAHSPAMHTDIPFADMLNLYDTSCIVPNESILGEVNFRLMEAASSGCLVLDQNLGEAQQAMFMKGDEFDTYDDVVELDHKLSHYLDNEQQGQAMGRAAYDRIHAEHLPKHRVRQIIEFAQSATRNRAQGDASKKWTTLSAFAMWETGISHIETHDLLTRFDQTPQDELVTTAMIHAMVRLGQSEALGHITKALLGGNQFPESLEVNLACSMASIRLDQLETAKAFLYRHLSANKLRQPPAPESSKTLLTLWAKELQRLGRITRSGFPFDPQHDLPTVATECLTAILATEPTDIPTLRLIDILLRPQIGRELTRVGYLSLLTIHDNTDWRLAFEIAMANLKSYRLTSGLEELTMARELAIANRQQRVFDKALAANDPHGLITRKLNQTT